MTRLPHVMLEKLTNLNIGALKELWRVLYKSSPPQRMSRDFLIKLLAQGVQERTAGGMSKKVERQLAAVLELDDSRAALATQSSQGRLRLGNRLVRGWGGKTHDVTVVEQGFAYRGKEYRSLTEIAQIITGAHWSGPRFFGLTGKQRPARSAGSDS